MKIYATFGVPEYWIVDTDARTLEQYMLPDGGRFELNGLFEGDDRVASEKLPCVSFAVRDLFGDLPF